MNTASHSHYKITDLLPHRGPMLLIDELVCWGEDWIECAVWHRQDHPFIVKDNKIPSWVGLEYMCQASALLEGIKRREKGSAVPTGLFLGTRQYQATTPHFSATDKLVIRAQELIKNTDTIAVYTCQINNENGENLATATIKAANVSVFDWE